MNVKYPLNGSCKNLENPAIRIYGNRFHSDQSLYEYLIEFLLVFSSAKAPDGTGEMSFHSDEPLYYFVKPRNGLRRFIFFDQAKRAKRIPGDERANESIKKILLKHIEADKASEKEEFLQAVQDLFRGYAAVLKNRSWCAQTLLPLCPEMIFCEEMPNDNIRLKWEKGSEADRTSILKKCHGPVAAGYSIEDTFYDDSFELPAEERYIICTCCRSSRMPQKQKIASNRCLLIFLSTRVRPFLSWQIGYRAHGKKRKI